MPSAQRRKARGKAKRLGLREFARKLKPKASLAAVQKAIRSGRLTASVGRDAKGSFIADKALALREWSENATKPPNPGGANGKAPVAGLSPTASLMEAQRRLVAQRELGLDLTNRQRQGKLLDADAARREFFEAARTFREAMLAIPDRNASQLAAETNRARVHEMLEEAIRAALEVVAEHMVDGE